MRKSVASFAHTLVAALMAAALAFSMVPLAWADDGPAGTIAGTVAGSVAEGSEGTAAPSEQDAPEASTQSAETKAAEGSSAGGTTVSIAVYRSSFPINDWVLKSPDDKDASHEPSWENRPSDLPTSASPGQACTVPSGYTRDMEPVREGYIFAGWSLDPTSPKGSYLDALKVPDGAPQSKGYAFYAIWTPEVYAVVFDLAKNPAMDGVDREGAAETEASFDLNWPELAATERTIASLGSARYRVTGFTVKDSVHDADYDPDTGLIKLPEPKRTGYRFLGWAEPDGQKVSVDAKDGAYGLNLARLPQIDGTPVLTARWTSGFGVTAPLSITFGDYDKTGAPGNPWLGDKDQAAADDSTQAQQDKEGASEQEGYAKGGQAFFENTSWHEAVKLVGLTSARHANANQVLTTYDTSKASEAHVLGDGTEENPGERLLSLYPSATAPADKSSGIHFRLTDTVTEAGLGDAFTMAPQGEEGARKDISYGLNLATDPVDGSANHGLVLPTDDYERKQIATVSYTFATATAANEDPYVHNSATGTINDDIYVEYDGKVYGTHDILHAADCISKLGESSPCYALYNDIMHAQGVATNGILPSSAGAKIYARYTGPEATAAQPNSNRQGFVRLLLIGLNHDVVSLREGSPNASGFAGDGSKDATNGAPYVTRRAGFTFQFADVLLAAPMSSAHNVNGGWSATSLRSTTLAEGGAIYNSIAIRDSIKSVIKFSNNRASVSMNWDQVTTTTTDKLFIGSYKEILGGYYGSSLMHDDNPYSWLNHDGYHYEYYSDVCKAAHHPMSEPAITRNLGALCKGMALSDATAARAWWLRTPNTPGGVDHTFIMINNSTGDDVTANSGEGNGTSRGVVPCFCL